MAADGHLRDTFPNQSMQEDTHNKPSLWRQCRRIFLIRLSQLGDCRKRGMPVWRFERARKGSSTHEQERERRNHPLGGLVLLVSRSLQFLSKSLKQQIFLPSGGLTKGGRLGTHEGSWLQSLPCNPDPCGIRKWELRPLSRFYSWPLPLWPLSLLHASPNCSESNLFKWSSKNMSEYTAILKSTV